MRVFDCEEMAKEWAKSTAKKIGIKDKKQIDNLKEYYKNTCEKKTEKNWVIGVLRKIFGS